MYSAKDPSFRSLLKRSIYLPIGLMTLLLLVLSWLLQVTTDQTHEVSQSLTVIAKASNILTLIVDEETAVRGFELTKDKRFMLPYTRSEEKLPLRFADLKAMIKDDPAQVARLAQVQDLFNKWHAISVPTLNTIPIQQRISQGLSQKLEMDQLRGDVAALIRAQQDQLDIDVEKQRSSALLMLLVLGGGAIVVGALLSYLSFRSIKGLSGRYEETLALVQKQTDELRASHNELDRRVDERTRELNAVNQELEMFCYSAAHDLRAPLRWIIGTNKLFIEDYANVVPKAGLDDLERVNDAATRLSKLIDSLLEMARLGKVDIRKASVNLSDITSRVVQELKGRDWGGPVEVEIQPDLHLEGDPLLISMVMQNLLENACKFSGRTGAGKVVVAAYKEGEDQVFSVTDNGVGFDNAYINKLFQPFERLHRNDEFAGTGMGLANAKRIIERHGGRIWADGKPGVGATFFFSLPSE
jgi:signal transduction histidine kinase